MKYNLNKDGGARLQNGDRGKTAISERQYFLYLLHSGIEEMLRYHCVAMMRDS